MAAVVAGILELGGGPSQLAAVRVVAAVGAGAFVYFLVVRALGLAELRALGDLRRRSA